MHTVSKTGRRGGEIPGAKVSRENVRFPRSRRSGIISARVKSSVVELDCVVASRDAITSRFRLCVVTADDVVFVFARSRYDSID